MIPRLTRRPTPSAATLAAACLAVLVLGAPGAVRAQPMAPVPGPAFQRLKYSDSLSSVNDRCVVTHNKLNPAIHPLYVNGQPVGFC
jgi:hypothetical protein